MIKAASIMAVAGTLLATPAFAQSLNSTTNPGSPITTGSAPASVQYSNVSGTDVFTSNLKGLNVYNQNNESVGEISDIAIGANNQVQALILSVGGFLGVGDRYVAIAPSSLKVTYDESNKKWHATINATKEQLKSAPDFKYPNNKG
ncbi:MAG: PRC-barrel domain-containing protein [Xanthobacteraceae bacterium]|nr:PRC-barrel domain-containing protein [Xanthobacteraceae bacterium]